MNILNDTINSTTEISKIINTSMKMFNKITSNHFSDSVIRQYYRESGEKMFEQFKTDLKGFEEQIRDNMKSIDNLLANNNLDRKQNEILNESKELNNESLEIIDKIQNTLDDAMKRLNNALVGTLEGLTRDVIKIHEIPPRNLIEEEVIKQKYSKGGLQKSRKRKNKTKNKKYTKRRTYEILEKYFSKKTKTRKMKKNYL